MKIKKYMLAVVLMAGVQSVCLAQGKAEMTVAKGNFTQTETGSVTLFTFSGNEGEVRALKSKAAQNRERITLEMNKNADGTYACKLIVEHQNQPEYAEKMLLTLGIEKVFIGGEEKSVLEITTDLEAMK